MGATEPPLLFLTNTARINKLKNKERAKNGEEQIALVENFREEVAKEKEYKGTRKADKPFHYYNLLAHIRGSYNTMVHEGGIEADDYMCITQFSRLEQRDTIICSRDKDLRQCPGFHFSWEVAKQPSYGPVWVEPIGHLELQKNNKKLFGTGHKFFYSQLLTGDVVDNIGGLPKFGPVAAFKLLHDVNTEYDCYKLVSEKYIGVYGDEWKEKLLEQAYLLWMIRELNEDGSPKMWEPPKKE